MCLGLIHNYKLTRYKSRNGLFEKQLVWSFFCFWWFLFLARCTPLLFFACSPRLFRGQIFQYGDEQFLVWNPSKWILYYINLHIWSWWINWMHYSCLSQLIQIPRIFRGWGRSFLACAYLIQVEASCVTFPLAWAFNLPNYYFGIH